MRTLQHYDRIGLLEPKKDEKGYRFYSDEDIDLLQTILFYKYLGFSLKEIKELVDCEDATRLNHLKHQLVLLQNEKKRLITLVATLEKTIESEERSFEMSNEEKFVGFTVQDNAKYQHCAIKEYGEEMVLKSNSTIIIDVINRLFIEFAQNMSEGLSAISKENGDLVAELYQVICENAFDCTLEDFSGIAYAYVKNPEFSKNINQFGEGVSQYICDAVQEFVSKHIR
ncbi:DNA-binding transcriptional regulator, MerR family [Granulicatella balaenopterae]|uniref:DNA-binding transcriptional regulator, MerR family n=1 Tax=Granulicatella balaenopterae TaxID=137733 RepID=A0A1H9GWG7_9LACT|nr:DNA-binding transcriptional regulator, MerR family [Granulicatella balaenopterae]